MSGQNVYSVSAVSRYIKELFRQDFLLHHIYVKGEVSNCKYHSSGHLYFTLKDEGGAISAVMWKSIIRRGMPVRVKDGDTVIAMGDIEVYEQAGRYQLYAKEIRIDGSGALWQAFEERKARLEEMGMFSPEYKKPIPEYAKTVGIVTAPTGAAIQDIRSISARRNPYVQLILYPSQVQGEGAVPDIVRGIEVLDGMGLDVIIVGRGGGSIEDLWAFNSEEVAYAIFHCRTPVISAVGHETDTTIADYVADLRAPTPSAAAELAVCEISAVFDRIAGYEKTLTGSMEKQISEKRRDLRLHQMHLRTVSPQYRLNENRQRLSELERQMETAAGRMTERRRERLALLSRSLEGLSPLKQMQRGYAFVSDADGHAKTSIGQVQVGERLMLHLADGQADVRVESVGEERKKR